MGLFNNPTRFKSVIFVPFYICDETIYVKRPTQNDIGEYTKVRTNDVVMHKPSGEIFRASTTRDGSYSYKDDRGFYIEYWSDKKIESIEWGRHDSFTLIGYINVEIDKQPPLEYIKL